MIAELLIVATIVAVPERDLWMPRKIDDRITATVTVSLTRPKPPPGMRWVCDQPEEQADGLVVTGCTAEPIRARRAVRR